MKKILSARNHKVNYLRISSNCMISGNWTYCIFPTVNGGGIYCNSSSPVLANCTISGNDASGDGGGIYCYSSFPVITDCILWGDAPEELSLHDTSSNVTYSDVEGGWEGAGNLNADPLFAGGFSGNFYLSQTAAGQAADSPCLDAGHDLAAVICFPYPVFTDCLSEFTTRTDAVSDAGRVDIGYHHSSVVGVSLSMPALAFHPGSDCRLTALTYSDQPAPLENLPLVVVLDLEMDVYWFYPHWGEYPPTFDYELITLHPGTEEKTIIASFTWPDTGGDSYDKAHFYGALLTRDCNALYGVMGSWDFGWGP